MSNTDTDFEKVVMYNIDKLLSHEINKSQCVSGMMFLIRTASNTVSFPHYTKLKEMREALNMTIGEVSVGCGVSKATISRIERGNSADYKNVAAIYTFLQQQPTF